jgi:uncharacterized membrane protein YeiH
VDDVVTVPVWVDAMAVTVGAIAGALHAEKKRLDIVGILLLAVTLGMGGGIIRDLLLAQGTPVFLTTPLYLTLALVVGFVAFFFAATLSRANPLLIIFDVFGVGLFAMIGANKALLVGLDVMPAIFVGAAAGVGGGVMRDVLCGDVPVIMLPGRLNAVATVLGVVVFVALAEYTDLTAEAAAVIGVAFVAALRFLSAGLGWESPQPMGLDRRVRRWWRRRQSATPGPSR